MANAQTTIDLIFNGVDKTGAATLSALGNIKDFSGSVTTLTKPVADFTMGAVKLEAGLLAAGAAMVVFATKVAGDFDTSFRQITTLTDASGKDMGKFKDDILDYASGSTKSIGDISEAIRAAVGSGVDYSKSIDLISTAEKLAVSTKADLTGTTEVLVSTMNAYGLETKDSGKVADLFFQIIKDGKIEMSDLSRSLAMLTPVSAAAGVGMEEVGAAIAVLTASGMQPSTAIEYLRSALTNIIKPSEQAVDMANSLGIEFDSSALKTKGLAVVLDDVGKATKGNTGQMAKLIGDVGGLAAAMVLTGSQAGKFKDEIGAMGESTGSVATAFEKMTGSLDLSLQTVKNSFDIFMIKVGTPFLDEFGGIAKAIAKIFQALGASAMDENGLGSLVKYIEGIFGDIQDTLETVAKNLPAALEKADFSGFSGGIGRVIDAIKKLFGDIDLTTVDGLTRAIELAGAAFLSLSGFVEGVITGFKPLFDKLVELGTKVGGIDPDIAKISGNIGSVVTQFNLLAGGISSLIPFLETLIGLLAAKTGISLLSAVGLLPPALVKFVAGLVPVAAAVTAIGVPLGAIIYALKSWQESTDKTTESQKLSVKITQETREALVGFAESTGYVVTSLDEINKLFVDGQVVWNESTKSYERAGSALKGVGESVVDADKALKDFDDAMVKNADSTGKAAKGSTDLAKSQKDTNEYIVKSVPIYDALTGKITGYEQQLVKAGLGTEKLSTKSGETTKKISEITKEVDKAKDAQEKWNQEIEKMKFQEKLKLIEQQTKIMTAQIEADAKKTVAAFESIGKTMESTGGLLGTLFSQFKDFDSMSWSQIRSIEKQIDSENKMRSDAFNLQKELTQAQIEQMRAQTNALTMGEGLIKVDGAGLKPHLEAFMWEILRAIQVKVNKDGLKMLLGA